MKISEMCNALNLEFQGDDYSIGGLNLCNRESKKKQIISYVTSDKYVEQVRDNTSIIALVLSKSEAQYYASNYVNRDITYIFSSNPEKTFYDMHDYLYYKTNFYDKFDFAKVIGKGCIISEFAVIQDGVILGDNVTIGANTVIKKGTQIGNNTSIGCNCTIGSEGFQVLRCNGLNRRIVQAGGLYIGEHVDINDNVTIANSMFEDTTYIGNNVKIDNLVYIGHNSIIKENAVVTAGTTLCGSSYVEANAWIGAGSVQLNRVRVGENSLVGIGSVVTKDIANNSVAYGNPAQKKSEIAFASK